MGQAQRSDRRSTSRADSARRDGISVIAGGRERSGTGRDAQRNRSSRKGGGLENLELWEISREDDSSRMMRLADRDQVRSRQKYVKRRRARRRQRNLYRLFAFVIIGVCLILIYQTTGAIYRIIHNEKTSRGKGIAEVISEKIEGKQVEPPEMVVDYLDLNEYSRPGTKLKKIKSIFVHYTANPGTSAAQNRSYFANLAQTHERSASAHFIIGYEGEVIQCIPLEEQAYAVATRNGDSVSIECCYLDEDGKFTQETYDTLVHTLAWLTQEYRLSVDDILRHYDCGGKKCPLYYVEHEDAWEKLLADVEAYKESL